MMYPPGSEGDEYNPMDDFNEKYTASQRTAREKGRTSVDSVTGERGRKGDYSHSGAGFLVGPGKKRGVKSKVKPVTMKRLVISL